MINEYQRKVIRSLKNLEQGDFDKEIPIISDKKVIIGFLKPIDAKLSDNEEVTASLTRWRQMFMRYFLTQFEAMNERTKSWLNNVVIKDDSRLLFLITDETNRSIGNFGICNITSDGAELDNLIRGERGGHPKIIFFSEVSLINWMYKTLGVNSIYLHVFSNNSRTILLHESVGFIRGDIYKLIKKEHKGKINYKIDLHSKPIWNEFGLMKMTLDKDKFLSQYPWLQERE